MTDGELVRQTLDGRSAAYEELVRRWASRMLAFCHAKVGSRHVAEDMAQESLLRSFRSLPTLTDPDKFGSWLRGIALRVCLDWLKSKQSHQVSFAALGEDQTADELLADSAGGPEIAVDRADQLRQLMSAVEALPEEFREVIMLYYYQDVTYGELAQSLGVSSATINARLTKARALLRERLSGTRRSWMDCWQAQDLLSAWLDGESNAADRIALEAHLLTCTECRLLADAVRVEDADLRRAFAPSRQAAHDVAARTIAQLRPAKPPRRGLPNWLALPLATAAGFLIAVVTMRPPAAPPENQAPMAQTPIAPPLARLALATGPVDVLSPRRPAWHACPTSTGIESGTSVRTAAQSRCEIDAAGGAQVRLNGSTEVRFANERQMELSCGQLWSAVGGGQTPLEIAASDAVVVADDATFDLRREADETVLTVIEGTAEVRSGDERHTISAGQSATIVAGSVSHQQRALDPLLASGWIHPLLVLKGPDDPELAARMNHILARLGQAKLSYLYEDEIRRLGDHCVLPLARYLESSRSEPEQPRRVTAARIIADVAQPRATGELIFLLSDPNPAVRFQAAQALRRLTGNDQGRPPEQWQADPWTACEPTHRAWQQWWEKNWNRYPGADPPKPELMKKG